MRGTVLTLARSVAVDHDRSKLLDQIWRTLEGALLTDLQRFPRKRQMCISGSVQGWSSTASMESVPCSSKPIQGFIEGKPDSRPINLLTQKTAHSEDFAIPDEFFTVLPSLKAFDQLADLRLGQNTLLNGIAIVNLACHSLPIRHVLDFKVTQKQPVSPAALT